jgi:hypothetical protein
MDKLLVFLRGIIPIRLRLFFALGPKMARLRGKKVKLDRLRFGVFLAENCNLNCAYCAQFSPLATKDASLSLSLSLRTRP